MNITKPRLDQFKITGSTVGDLYFTNVKLLLPLNGTNGATTTSDSSNDNRTITFEGSNSNISTGQSKFGASSLSISGTDNSYITVSSDGMNAAGDFTFECWIYDTSDQVYPCLFSNKQSSSNALHAYVGAGATSGASKAFRFTSQGTSTNFSTELPTNQWYHLALVRDGSTIKLYVNGTADATTISNSSTILFGGGSVIWIGYNSNTYRFNGYLDDIRFTNGLARYTSNFTPPTSAHLTQAGDVNKHIVVNSDADGVAIGTGGINQARVAKAWVNFDGTGTVAIRTSYNVSSITDDGTGKYDVNFSTAMPDNDYSVVSDGRYNTGDSAGSSVVTVRREALTTSKFGVRGANVATEAFNDFEMVSAIVFGN
jgi:hypothetical protein